MMYNSLYPKGKIFNNLSTNMICLVTSYGAIPLTNVRSGFLCPIMNQAKNGKTIRSLNELKRNLSSIEETSDNSTLSIVRVLLLKIIGGQK